MDNNTEITVNDVKITPDDINAEMQYHPSDSLLGAQHQAAQALVVKALLSQRAKSLNINEPTLDETFEILFEQEINSPEPDDEECLRFYENKRQQFFSSPLFEAAHILFLKTTDDSLIRANKALKLIHNDPEIFEKIAKKQSACSSAKIGGHLGQVTKGQTTPVFEGALFNMAEGEISDAPLKSEFGYHLIKVYKRLEGKQLPFEHVKQDISEYMSQQSWQRAFSQYIQILASEAKISGFKLKQAEQYLTQ